MNRLVCSELVQGIHRIAVPEVIVVLDGLLDAAKRARHIANEQSVETFWLAGNEIEQQRFLSQFQPPNLVQFAVSSNTKDQAEKVAERAWSDKVQFVGIIDYDCHVVRSILTLIGQARKFGTTVQFIPYAYVDMDRGSMLPELRELGLLIEAVKLWYYQRKGDVATLQQALDYYDM